MPKPKDRPREGQRSNCRDLNSYPMRNIKLDEANANRLKAVYAYHDR